MFAFNYRHCKDLNMLSLLFIWELVSNSKLTSVSTQK
jgi:hypothetical protein